jgi:hypothetical protein
MNVLILSVLFVVWGHAYAISGQSCSLLMGSIVFPVAANWDGSVPVYYKGKQIGTNLSQDNCVTFDILRGSGCDRENLFLILADPCFIRPHFFKFRAGNQTIPILDAYQIQDQAEYLFYELSQEKKSGEVHWCITQKQLPKGNIIPDNTIIILFPAKHVTSVSGGDFLSLPTIYVKLLQPEEFYSISVVMQCASLEMNTTHPICKIVSNIHECTVMQITMP